MSPQEAPCLPPAPLRALLGLSPASPPAAKIKNSICIAGKSCKSLLSLSSCSRTIRGVISAGTRPAALCSSLSWAVLPLPVWLPWDARGAGGEQDPGCLQQSTHGTAQPGDKGLCHPRALCDGDTGANGVPTVSPAPLCPRVPPTRTLCPHSRPTLRARCRIM